MITVSVVQPCQGSISLTLDHRRGRTQEENVISAIRKTLSATAVVTLVLTGAAACGTVENLSAGQKLDRAFDKLGKEKSISLELDLDTDAATVQSLDAKASEPGEEIPKEAAELIAGGSISISMESKKPLAESGEKDFIGMAMKVSGADGELVEYRMAGDYSYFRIDMEAFGKLSGEAMPPAEELPDSAGPLKKVFSGDWVKVSNKEMRKTRDEMTEALGEKGAKPEAKPTLDAAAQKKLTDALRDAITREVEFKTADGKDGAERVTATAPLRALVTELVDAIRPLAKELPPGMQTLPTAKELKEVPNTKATADFILKDEALTEMSVDLTKLDKSMKADKFALVLRVGAGDKPTAPAGATEIKVDELMEGFFGGGPSEGLPGENASVGISADVPLDAQG
ncbi:hypothetical protein [Streptomyces sp. NPDC020141]|uniref:hypothetical protein n=1 Tax=Streptomyces sp. NPDC020141 TaxID=3365065 RepID=UPI0037A039FA